MGKTTDKLNLLLKNTKNIEQYIKSNEDYLAERDLAGYLEKLLSEKHMKKSELSKRAGLNSSYVYDIFAGRKKPSRNKVLAMCFGFKLNSDESNHLLNYASLSELYPRIKRDSIIIFALDNNIDIDRCNYLLMDSGEEAIM